MTNPALAPPAEVETQEASSSQPMPAQLPAHLVPLAIESGNQPWCDIYTADYRIRVQVNVRALLLDTLAPPGPGGIPEIKVMADLNCNAFHRSETAKNKKKK